MAVACIEPSSAFQQAVDFIGELRHHDCRLFAVRGQPVVPLGDDAGEFETKRGVRGIGTPTDKSARKV